MTTDYGLINYYENRTKESKDEKRILRRIKFFTLRTCYLQVTNYKIPTRLLGA